MELKKLTRPPSVTSNPSNLRVLRAATPVVEARTTNLPYQRLWNSFFARMLGSLLVVALPFFIIAGLVPDLVRPWGLAPQVIAIVLLVGITAVTARLMVRPIVALARAAASAEVGDLSVRVVPSGSTEVRQLVQAFNSMLDRRGVVVLRIRGEVTDSAGQLAQAAQELVGATQEQTTATSNTSATMEELSRSSASIAKTAAAVKNQAADVRARIAIAQTEDSREHENASTTCRRG